MRESETTATRVGIEKLELRAGHEPLTLTLVRGGGAAILHHLSELVRQSRRVEADLIAHIGEVDQRRLYTREACSSMFAYCSEVLHLSEAESYFRIAVARAARKFPSLLLMLGDGRLHLSGIALLAPHLTEENFERVLARAKHKSKRQIEKLVAELAPKPDVPASIRRLPTPVVPAVQLRPERVAPPPPPPSNPAPAPPPKLEPLAPDRHKVTFTASSELRDKLERLQALMDGDLAAVSHRSGGDGEARKARSETLWDDVEAEKRP